MERYDIAIIGTGPAGLSAAITAKVRNKNVLLLGSKDLSSKLGKAHEIQNYLGFPAVKGEDLAAAFTRHIEEMGLEITEKRVSAVYSMGEYFAIQADQDMLEAKTVILATGVVAGKALPGEEELLGRGVSYCATCDGMLYRGKTVAVVGGGEEARHDGDFLESIGCTVLRFEQNGKYEIRGGMKADTLVFGGEEHKVDGVFIIKDTVSVTQLVPGLTYENGGIVVDRHMATAVPGVFAAGDCTGKPLQLAKAVGEGNVAALAACDWLDKK